MGLATLQHVGSFWIRDWTCVSCIDWRTPHDWAIREAQDYFFWCVLCLKSLLNLLQHCFYFIFWFCGHEACEILAPQPEIQPIPPALEGEVLTTGLPGKLPSFCFVGKSRGCSGSRKYYGCHFWGYRMDDIPSVILFLTLTQWLIIHACYPSLSSRSLNTLPSLLKRIHWQMLEIFVFLKRR